MKHIFSSIIIICSVFAIAPDASAAAFKSCGAGYVLVPSRSTVDGISTAECQKLWCRDLENGKSMGADNRAASGYQATSAPRELCDASGKCIECWGERKWCGGETPGAWNAEYGAYTRGGDNATYQSYQKGACFAWRLEKKTDCPDGQTAVLQDGKWVCAAAKTPLNSASKSSIRRTGATIRRIGR